MKKLLTNIFLVGLLLATTTSTVFAHDVTTITGTVQSVVIGTDAATGATIVDVTLVDAAGLSQTFRLDLQTAESLGLVITDPLTGVSTVAADAVGKVVEVDPATIVEDTADEKEHPVGSTLADFFSELLGVDYETIMTRHDDGIGFGVIAQALWLTNNIDGDTATFEALLEAKQSGDYSAITLADGSTPDNWGDVVKSLKKGNNLGSVMSGNGESDQVTPEAAGNVQSSGSVNASGNGNGSGNGSGRP